MSDAEIQVTGRGDSPDDVLCRFCGVTIVERPSKHRGTVWTRTGPDGPMVICEPALGFHEPYRDDPEHGHTFRLVVTSRGSYGIVGEEEHTDSEDFGPPFTVDVRAWNLPDALRQAAVLFPRLWQLDDDEVAPAVGKIGEHCD